MVEAAPMLAADIRKIGFVLFFLLIVGVCARPAFGYLRLHPSNTRYFQETTTGKAVLITAYGTVAPCSNKIDYVSEIKAYAGRGMQYVRMWHLLPWEGSDSIWPWKRSNTNGACMGGNKFDLNTWNNAYWSRISDCISRCNAADIYIEPMIFDRCGISPVSSDRWGNNPWASGNNVNNLELPDCSSDGTPDFYDYSSKPNLRNQQERYISKFIDETIAYPNVIYELENEHWEHSDSAWVKHYSSFIKNYINTTYTGSPRLVSYSSLESDLEDCFGIPAVDIINKHFGDETDPAVYNSYIEPRWSKVKAINIDEFANGFADVNILRKICWTIMASGAHFHIEDAKPNCKPYDIVKNINLFISQSGWDFVHSTPNKSLVTSGGGYCMADIGKEYLCYFTSGGSKTINLAPASYIFKWWNPRSGGFSKKADFSHHGGSKTFVSPNEDDWALYIRVES